MGSGKGEKKKAAGKKPGLLKRLFSSGLRSRSVGRLVASEGDGSASPDSPPATPATGAGAATPPFATPAAATPEGQDGAAATPAASPAAAAAAATPTGSPSGAASPSTFGGGAKSLMVQVIAARRLRAADSNGLSDPYCLVKVRQRGAGACMLPCALQHCRAASRQVSQPCRRAASGPAWALLTPPCPPCLQVGGRKACTKTELKTLEPVWNETVAFGPADIEEAEAGACCARGRGGVLPQGAGRPGPVPWPCLQKRLPRALPPACLPRRHCRRPAAAPACSGAPLHRAARV